MLRLALADPVLRAALHSAERAALPDWMIVSGAVVAAVWNALTGRPPGHGVRDIDLLYFDPDLSETAEDRVIRRATPLFAPEPPVEIRNQARVHLWYPARFGHAVTPLTSTAEALTRFVAKTQAIGVTRAARRGGADRPATSPTPATASPRSAVTLAHPWSATGLSAPGLALEAPFGLSALLELRMEPNPALPNRAVYEAKAEAWSAFWPEITVLPWEAPVELREAGPGSFDADGLLGLIRHAFAPMEGRIDPPSSVLALTPAALQEKAAAEMLLVAEAEGALLGCVFLRAAGDGLHLSRLAVAPPSQRRGIGRALVAAACEIARHRGLAKLRLLTRIELTENHMAFARLGFLKRGEWAHPGHDRPTAIVMEKDL